MVKKKYGPCSQRVQSVREDNQGMSVKDANLAQKTRYIPLQMEPGKTSGEVDIQAEMRREVGPSQALK